MPAREPSPGERVLSLWRRLSPLPFGVTLFMWVFRGQVPYSGALGARIERLEPGHARIALRDRRGVRNHLNSVHAIALANLGEMTSGLAMTTAMPPGVRAIVTHLEIDYAKKARGTLTAESRVALPVVRDAVDHDVRAEILDAAGDLVAAITVRWRLSPVPGAEVPRGTTSAAST
jgi:acyl-coenzyme A thioesterase PaaI-like protein